MILDGSQKLQLMKAFTLLRRRQSTDDTPLPDARARGEGASVRHRPVDAVRLSSDTDSYSFTSLLS